MNLSRLYYFILLALFAGLISCDEEIDFKNLYPDDKIVIDGWIENGQYAKVLLTRNAPYFSSLDSASIRSLVLTRAKVTLSDGIRSEVLILRKNEAYFPPYVFEGNEIKGETGKSYTIKAEYGGKTATGTTTIPPSVPLDTIFFVKNEGSDSTGTLYIEFTDPPRERNYYRILTRVEGKDIRFFSSLIMGISDEFISGEKFGFELNRGQETFLTSSKNKYFKLGENVTVKFCTIDKEHYEFWNSFQDEVLNSGNPFASSMSVIKSNIKGDGLGVWGGYGVNQYSIIIK
jgi:hypothetical protein